MKENILSVAVTFDTDWAPDWCIKYCFELCRQAGVKATFFATNPTPVLDEIVQDSSYEVGIHPNFLPGSSQYLNKENEPSYATVLDYCCSFVRNPKSMRTHGLYRSSRLYAEIETKYSSINNDCSILAFSQQVNQPYYAWHSDAERPLVHMPYHFEDDVACLLANFNFNNFLSACRSSSILIFDFHPIHVMLNSRSMGNYAMLKNNYSISECTQEIIAQYRHNGDGTHTYLEHLLMKASRSYTIDEIGEHFRNMKDFYS